MRIAPRGLAQRLDVAADDGVELIERDPVVPLARGVLALDAEFRIGMTGMKMKQKNPVMSYDDRCASRLHRVQVP